MKIILACGGTGGHIFPAFSVAEELRKRNPLSEIIYVCGNRDIETAIFKIIRQERVFSVSSAPFRGIGSLFSAAFLAKLTEGFAQSYRLLKKEKPDIVVGFGGHFSFPVVAMAKILGIATLIHEQNVVPGSANRVMAKWVDGVALSFGETKPYLDGAKNMKVTGNPIRSQIETALPETANHFFGFLNEKKTVLVLGGSQGSESINTAFFEALSFLEPELKKGIQVLHLCGKMPESQSQAILKKHGIDSKVFSFFDRMDLAYAACHGAVGRAGATFLAEIEARKIPAILIPYPFANGHQKLNADVFGRKNHARVVDQKVLTPQGLAEDLKWLLAQSFSGESVPTQARERLADFIDEIKGLKK